MRKYLAITATCLAVPALMGNQGGCEPQNTPSMQQIELYVPKSIRTCPRAPKSPGANSSPAQRAKYLVALYNVYEVCGGNMKQVDALITKWERAVEAKKRGR